MKFTGYLSVLLVLALTACGAAETDGTNDNESTEDVRASSWGRLLGSYTYVSGNEPYASIVFEQTTEHRGHHYFAERVVECFAAPCDPIREEGWYTANANAVTLHPASGDVLVYSYTHDGQSLELRMGRVTETLSSAPSYCDSPADCLEEGLLHILCATPAGGTQWSCDINHACHWNCTPTPTRCLDDSDCATGQTCQSVSNCPSTSGSVTCHSVHLECRPAPIQCIRACGTGQTNCAHACCVDLQNDSANCGACGNACASGETCVDGACEAPAPPECTNDNDCFRSGCSGEICANHSSISSCIWRDAYTCLQYESCGCNSGHCGFAPTTSRQRSQYSACTAVHGSL